MPLQQFILEKVFFGEHKLNSLLPCAIVVLGLLHMHVGSLCQFVKMKGNPAQLVAKETIYLSICLFLYPSVCLFVCRGGTSALILEM